MLRIILVDKSNRQWVVDKLRLDVITHVFAYYDLQYDQKNTMMRVAVEDDKLRGYILIYHALDFPSVVLECDSGDAPKLLEYAPEDGFIIHAPRHLLRSIEGKFPHSRHYVENWMIVKKGKAEFSKSEQVRRLKEADGSKLASILSSRKDRQNQSEEKYSDWIKKMPMYGVFVNGELVSYAGSFIQTREVWMIGGVYTLPNHRNRGYATLATSAITQEALKKSEAAALFVRSDNYPAIKAYEKIGYKKIGEKLWIDVGTGRKP
jgi:ribosomal protein S18 acetylase RimI-like enzyme